ncbi:hypothetical protein PLESTB_000983800 [Pleodorina starrii]|uniref:Uncharacterized protein n=1 Tax=Pleodorina starrii TaxID=330485 RepID=A0A9W6BNN2_9CHLO|nr:hypothetical protein PLESTM_000546400 [Pleodorina starrii]GLC55404.1 hypothetical protein PLESTB_000983800 [Pleodorina starrii]GLC73799.1 hypothetical protein PLESTF_001422400 [Pleodorina starrii]
MSPGPQSSPHVATVAESIQSIDDFLKSSAVASTTGAIAAVRQPRASSAHRRDEPRANNRRSASDVVVTSTKHVAKPWKLERATNERRGNSQAGESSPGPQAGSELRLTHDRLQQYAAAHARLTAPARPAAPRSTAGSTLLRKITNLGALAPPPPGTPHLGAPSPTGAVAVVRTVASAPVISPAALAGARITLNNPGIPLPGMGPPTGPRPASAQRPQSPSPHQMLQKLISFPQAQTHSAPQQQQQMQQRQQGAPPPDRAFGPRATDYTSRPSPTARPPALPGHGSGSSEHSLLPHPPHPPLNAKQRLPPDPRVGVGRGQNAGWSSPTLHLQSSFDSSLGSPAGHASAQGHGHGPGHGGWGSMEAQHSAGYVEAATAAAAAATAAAARLGPDLSPPVSPRPGSPSPQPPLLQLPPPHQYGSGPAFPPQPSTEPLPQLPSPHSQPQPHPPPAAQQQAAQPPNPQDRRLRPLTSGRIRRPQSSGPSGPSRWAASSSFQHQQQQQDPNPQQRSGEVVVVGLRDVPPSQLPFARAVVDPERAGGEGGGVGHGAAQQQQQRPGSGGSDHGTHASWWHRPPGGGGGAGDSEASYPLTAVTDRHVLGDDDMAPSEAAMWLSRMAELEAEVKEEREFRRKYEEELKMLAAAATAGGRGGRPSGGGPMLWQTTGGRVLSGARAAAAAVMRHGANARS